MIEIKDIEIVYDDYIILNKTDIDIPEHAITLIRGVSGSGKTSLLYRIGLISEDDHFYYNIYEDIQDDDKKSILRREYISFVLQDNSLFEQYDVLGNTQFRVICGIGFQHGPLVCNAVALCLVAILTRQA